MVTSSILIYLQFSYIFSIYIYIYQCLILKLSIPFMRIAQKSSVHTLYPNSLSLLIHDFFIFMLKTNITQNTKWRGIFCKTLCMVWCSKPAVTAAYVEKHSRASKSYLKKTHEILNPDITSYHWGLKQLLILILLSLSGDLSRMCAYVHARVFPIFWNPFCINSMETTLSDSCLVFLILGFFTRHVTSNTEGILQIVFLTDFKWLNIKAFSLTLPLKWSFLKI